MKVEIIAIGTELVNFRVSDTNSNFLVHELNHLGYQVNSLTLVKDDEAALEAVFSAALARSDIIITSGGLGPTHDDLTKRYVSKVLNRKLILNTEVLDNISKKYEEKQIEMPTNVQKQALLPRRSVLLNNKYGTAPGFICNENEQLIICLPGIPIEFEYMWTYEVKPYLIEKFGHLTQVIMIFVRTFGLAEIEINELLTPFFQQNGLTWNLMASEAGVDIEFFLDPTICSSYNYDSSKLKKDIKELLGSAIYAWDNISMEEVVGQLLSRHGLTLAIAESCTGGLIAHRLTQIPGSSKYLDRAIVTYSNRSKHELLDIKSSTLEEHGAVSSIVAREMAIGVRKRAGTDLGLSTTGIAGPEGGSDEKPVGLVYCGIASANECSSQSFRFFGERYSIKMKSSQAALNLLRQYLEERKPK